eukprot:jgi/Psemu1/6878/gm1.6878_g
MTTTTTTIAKFSMFENHDSIATTCLDLDDSKYCFKFTIPCYLCENGVGYCWSLWCFLGGGDDDDDDNDNELDPIGYFRSDKASSFAIVAISFAQVSNTPVACPVPPLASTHSTILSNPGYTDVQNLFLKKANSTSCIRYLESPPHHGLTNSTAISKLVMLKKILNSSFISSIFMNQLTSVVTSPVAYFQAEFTQPLLSTQATAKAHFILPSLDKDFAFILLLSFYTIFELVVIQRHISSQSNHTQKI